MAACARSSDSILIGKGEVAVLWVHRFSAEPFGQHRGSALNRYLRSNLPSCRPAVVRWRNWTVAALQGRTLHTLTLSFPHTHARAYTHIYIYICVKRAIARAPRRAACRRRDSAPNHTSVHRSSECAGGDRCRCQLRCACGSFGQRVLHAGCSVCPD
eukprot:scaffold35845_cov77-Phaeocystis_antarctica.AAC.2